MGTMYDFILILPYIFFYLPFYLPFSTFLPLLLSLSLLPPSFAFSLSLSRSYPAFCLLPAFSSPSFHLTKIIITVVYVSHGIFGLAMHFGRKSNRPPPPPPAKLTVELMGSPSIIEKGEVGVKRSKSTRNGRGSGVPAS